MTIRMFRYENRTIASRLIACVAALCWVAVAVPGRSAQEPKYEMGTFYVCLLIKPANFSVSQAPQQLIQNHFKHVQALIANGKAAVAGPFVDDNRIAGVFVLNAASPEEARALEEADPLVKEGGFSIEVLKWWAAKGIMKPPSQPFKQTTYYFTFLRRGPKWTAEKTPQTSRASSSTHGEHQRDGSNGKTGDRRSLRKRRGVRRSVHI